MRFKTAPLRLSLAPHLIYLSRARSGSNLQNNSEESQRLRFELPRQRKLSISTGSDVVAERQWRNLSNWTGRQNLADCIRKFQRNRTSIREYARIVVQFRERQNVREHNADIGRPSAYLDVQRNRGLLPNFPPIISRVRRLFRPPGAVAFPVV